MRAVSSLLAVALTTTALAVAGPSTAVAGDDAWKVPAQARITIKGHGYGHGHGMSQYGAEGAARQGLTHRQIAQFYYPGTRWGTSRGRITVLLTADTTDDLVVAARPGLTVRDTAGKVRTRLPENGASRWRVAVGPDGVDRVSYRDRRWHWWGVLEGQGEFAAGGEPVTLVTPSGERSYRGRLRVGVLASGDRVTVNDVGLESYLKGVVPLEIPASWSTEAVRAQAVAARTYASYERRHPQAGAYQLCDTWSCQVYGGVDAEYDASNRAVDATAGAILTSGGEPAFTQFGSSSGGWTSAGSMPYLPAQRDPYDGWSGNPMHTWTTTVDDTRLEQAWPAIGDLTRIAVTARDGNGDWGGRVRTVALRGSQGRVVVSGDTFRAVLGLRSTWVTFRVAPR
jgi:SpoIID/LytB domain protein